MCTNLSNFPEKIRKHFECKLLHEKHPGWNGEYEDFKGKKYKKIIWVCKVCNGKE